MERFCIFAGTTEGRTLAEFLLAQGAEVTACVATEYGEALIAPAEGLTVRTGRMDAAEMAALLASERFSLVLDATHPYAAAATEQLSLACRRTGTPCLRVLREASALPEDTVYVADAAGAAAFLNGADGAVLLTTGSKELGAFASVRGFSERVWARVLPMPASLEACAAAGLPPAHIIAMQGPFSAALNAALLRAVSARFLVTKDGGGAGGFPEKAEAARETGARLVVIGRPPQQEGLSLAGAIEALCRRFGFRPRPEVAVCGIGPGSAGAMTAEVREAVSAADCLIGAKRMLEAAAQHGQRCFEAVAPETIAACIRSAPEARRFAVLMSGDTGFFSGAKKLLPLLADCDARVLPGLSSLAVLCARLGRSWEDTLCVSLHGRDGDIALPVRRSRSVFALTGGDNGAAAVCRRLTEAGLGSVAVHIGERLSYPDERICSGTAAELAEGRYDSLSAVLIENPAPENGRFFGLPDSAFLRTERVPMTKSEVRAVVLSKLRLRRDSVCWDVGAGTGSVSVEMALLAPEGSVYAIEKNESALAILRGNRGAFMTENLHIVPGTAPEACEELPAPSHVFLGGTAGRAREILALALEKNPEVRVVATAVTLESVAELNGCRSAFPFTESEAVSLSVARDREAGSYHLMTGQNPVYIYTMQAGVTRE